MKAIVWTAYGSPDVLELQEIDKPIPKDDELLIRVRATSVTADDCETRSLQFPFWLTLPMRAYLGFSRPRRMMILGQEFAGDVEAVGKDVRRFKIGDPVFGTLELGAGAYAEYVCVKEESEDTVVAFKPANMSYVEAAGASTGGLEALHFLQAGNVQEGDKLLINGAGGSIGTAGIQLAKYHGAEVTAVDSGDKLDMLRSIGADHVIDYTKDDFSQQGVIYDVIFDVIGKNSFWRCLRVLNPNGKYLLANPKLWKLFAGFFVSRLTGKQIMLALADRKTEDLMYLKELIETGHIKTVIDREYPLEQTAEAHRYVETGRKAGNLIITV